MVDQTSLQDWVASFLKVAQERLPEIIGATVSCQMHATGREGAEYSWFLAFVDGRMTFADVGEMETPDCTFLFTEGAFERLLSGQIIDYAAEMAEGDITLAYGDVEQLLQLSVILDSSDWRACAAAAAQVVHG